MADELKDIVLQKEQEWRDLYQLRLKNLENSLEVSRRELAEEKCKFQQLKEDFKFNFRLLQDRDKELEKYEKLFKDLESVAKSREVQVSDLKIALAQAQDEMNKLTDIQQTTEREASSQLLNKQRELDTVRSEYEIGIKQLKTSLEKENQQLKITFEEQKNYLARDYDEACRKQEREFAVRIDELRTENLSLELKVKMLNRELELERTQKDTAFQSSAEREHDQKRLVQELKHKEWELEDLTIMSSAKQKELEEKILHLENSLTKCQTEISQASVTNARQVQQMKIELTKARDDAKAASTRLQQEQALRHNIEHLKTTNEEKLASQISSLKNELKKTLHYGEKERKQLKTEVKTLQEKLTKYQGELLTYSNRETSLERSKVQLELDFSKKLTESERTQAEKLEALISELTEKRKLAESLAAERQRIIEKLNVDLEQCKKITLKDELEQENIRLREVIRQMREACDDAGPPSVAQEYVKGLEKDLQEAKTKLRQAEYDLEVAQGETHGLPNLHNATPSVQAYIEQVNKEILALKQDKLKLTTQSRQLQLRLEEKELEFNERKDALQKVTVQLEQAQYEASSRQRAHHAEEISLKSRVRELEAQVRETRLECDELSKNHIELTAQCQRLTQEITLLQLKETSPALNFGAQELLIQQLQERVLQQRSSPTLNCPQNCPLREKLAQALCQLAAANKDRQHLIQVVNRLRHSTSVPGSAAGLQADVMEQQKRQLEELQKAIFTQTMAHKYMAEKATSPKKESPPLESEAPTRDIDFDHLRFSKDSEFDRLNQKYFSVLNETLESTREDLKIEGKKEIIRPKPSVEPQKPQPRVIRKPQKQARNWNVKDKK